MRVDEKYAACVSALKSYADSARFTDAVVGLSGGVDSAVTAVMCVDAFGTEHVHGVLMPGPFSSDHSVSDARDLAVNLGIDTVTLPIAEPYKAFEQVLAEACGGSLSGLAAENTQARCRMIYLMALSNAHGWMVVNTGNKSEAMMGYSTLYGDTAGAFAPMGGLYKTDVYAVGLWRNEQAVREVGHELIPRNTFEKPPSAELSPDQEDEKSLGMPYDKLDAVLIALIEEGKSVEEIAAGGAVEVEEVRRVAATMASYAFKRALEPPYPDVKFY